MGVSIAAEDMFVIGKVAIDEDMDFFAFQWLEASLEVQDAKLTRRHSTGSGTSRGSNGRRSPARDFASRSSGGDGAHRASLTTASAAIVDADARRHIGQQQQGEATSEEDIKESTAVDETALTLYALTLESYIALLADHDHVARALIAIERLLAVEPTNAWALAYRRHLEPRLPPISMRSPTDARPRDEPIVASTTAEPIGASKGALAPLADNTTVVEAETTINETKVEEDETKKLQDSLMPTVDALCRNEIEPASCCLRRRLQMYSFEHLRDDCRTLPTSLVSIVITSVIMYRCECRPSKWKSSICGRWLSCFEE